MRALTHDGERPVSQSLQVRGLRRRFRDFRVKALANIAACSGSGW